MKNGVADRLERYLCSRHIGQRRVNGKRKSVSQVKPHTRAVTQQNENVACRIAVVSDSPGIGQYFRLGTELIEFRHQPPEKVDALATFSPFGTLIPHARKSSAI
jgi:hypothetical protein